MLWIAVFIPDLSLQLVTRGQTTSGALVITSGPSNRPTVFAANDCARTAGIKTGMTIAAARAFSETLQVVSPQPGQNQQALHNLAGWACQFTPNVSLVEREHEHGLLLEVSITLTLHHGLSTLLNKVRRGCQILGYHVSVGVAPTPLAAWVLAKARDHGYEVRMCQQLAEIQSRIADLPLALLPWPHDTINKLATLGVIRFADCLALPEDGLAKRFGQDCLFDLQRVLGARPDPRLSFVPPDTYRARAEFGFEINDAMALLFPLNRLLTELEGYLRGRGCGVICYQLKLDHPSRLTTTIKIGMAKVERAADRLLSLAREHLNKTTLPDHVLAISIFIEGTQPFQETSASWLPDPKQQPDSWYRLIDKLSARLGQENVYQLKALDDHRPERSWQAVQANTPIPAKISRPRIKTRPATDVRNLPNVPNVPTQRPLLLLTTPRKLLLDHGRPTCHGAVELISGPERIETGWWDGQPASRDYFVGRNRHGETMWLYQNHATPVNSNVPADWYLQGYFA